VAATGHFLPALALARQLRERGSEVLLNVPERWRETVEEAGIRLLPWDEAGEDCVAGDGWPATGRIAEIARSLAPAIRAARPHVLVSDPFTQAPMLAAEMAGVRTAALVPDPYYAPQRGLPVFVQGLLPPRTRLGRSAWNAAWPLADRAMSDTRRIQNDLRAQLDLPPRDRFDAAITDGLTLVATFPQLEYPRRWPAGVHVTGPMLIDLVQPPFEPPPGEDPLVVVVASTTGLDSSASFVRTALEALAEEPVRVVASLSERGMRWTEPTPDNAVVVDWLQLSRATSEASAVVCHGGHGTVAGALSAGVPVLVCPMGGNTAQTGARVAWAKAGLTIPRRLFASRPLRWAVRRLIADPRFAVGARRIAAWAERNQGPVKGAELVERYARL
jgi:UDP:flavonoid glycosyltransferase YjiC (YdhE family)